MVGDLVDETMKRFRAGCKYKHPTNSLIPQNGTGALGLASQRILLDTRD
jgi:hypothetical protein